MNKRDRIGITLIALIITIIVLLILAGISIALVVGDNGVLSKAKDSSSATKIGQMKEAIQLAASDLETEYFEKIALSYNVNFDDEVNYGTLGTALNNQGYKLLIKGGVNDKKTVLGNTIFPEFEQASANFYISDGINGIVVKINKSPGGTALVIDYERIDGEIVLVSAKPEEGTTSSNLDGPVVSTGDSIASVVSVGDYVDIKVPYTNKKGDEIYYTTTGWRVLHINTSTGIVRLISTVQPLTFFHPSTDSATSLVELQKISTGAIEITEANTRGYKTNGFSTNNVKSLFSNTSVFSEISIPTKDDIIGISKNADLRTTGQYYWLGEIDGTDTLYNVKGDGNIDSTYNSAGGVRLVVTLAPEVTIKDGEGTSATPYRLNGINYN